MVLESTIICVDNSQFMRNGDFHPTRLQAQQVPSIDFFSLIKLASVYVKQKGSFRFPFPVVLGAFGLLFSIKYF